MWQNAVVFVVLTIAALVRVYKLDSASYWIDEMVSLHFAKSANWMSVFWDNNPPTYHFLLKGWVRAFGDSEAATRTLSVLCSLGATGVLMRVGFELRGALGGLAVGLVHALSFMSIAYAQETRMYALFELAMAVNFLFFLRVLREGRGGLGYVLSCLAMAFIHYLAIVPITIGCALLARRLGRKVLLGLAGAIAVELVFYSIFFKWEGLKWQMLKFSLEPHSHWPVEPIGALFNRSYFYGAGVLAAVALVLRRKKLGQLKPSLSWLALLVLPFLALLVFGFATKRSVFLARYFVYLTPVFAVAVGVLLVDLKDSKWPQALKLVPLALLTVGTALGFPGVYRSTKEPWRSVAELIGRYPNGLVLTTRTVAIGTPYFERADVRVEKWEPSSNAGMDYLEQQVRRRKRVWIIENYWGGTPYMPMLARQLKALGYRISEVSMRTDESAPVLVMLVEEKR